MSSFPAALPPERLLLGPGPSPVHPDVLAAQTRGVVGHLDPWFVDLIDEVAAMLRTVLRTDNDLTLPVAGTGAQGMEAAVVNLVEPGDRVVVGVNGLCGVRIADCARRAGADVVTVEEPWGRTIPPERIEAALGEHPDARFVAVVHAEASTGAWQPLDDVGRIVSDTDSLLLVDAVTSLGGVPLEVDDWGLDVVFSATHTCLSVPPGLAPVTFSPKAEAVLASRTAPVRSCHLDLAALRRPWGGADGPVAPVGALLGLHEGLRRVIDEGLERRWARHAEVGVLFQEHLGDRDATLLAEAGDRLPQLTCFAWPDDVDEGALRACLLHEHGIEVGAGLGDLAGRAWRVGLMGEGATHATVDRLLDAVDELLER